MLKDKRKNKKEYKRIIDLNINEWYNFYMLNKGEMKNEIKRK